MTDPSSVRDELQTTLGPAYTIERELGGGGMSRVFLATESRLDRPVVIKVLSAELAEGISADRFAREIKVAAQLQEPHIVPVLTDGVTTGGLPYYIMPFVRGASLRQRLTEGRIPPTTAVEILRDVMRALAYAHGRGIVHRDIKPENVLLHEGTAVVTDFGIAKALSASKTRESGATLTAVGTSLGTPAYMAPEQAAGDEVDHRADIYAWGVMAYEVLSGVHPFAGKTTAQQLIAAQISESPPPLRSSLGPLITQCLEKDPAKRPQSAADILGRLESGPTRGQRTWRYFAFGTAAAVLLAIGGVFAFRAGSARPDVSSIVVLPFENRGPAERSFFADGLTDAVTDKLVGVSGLTVIDHRSAATYKGSTKTAQQIGRELDVGYALEGVVTWATDASGQWRAEVLPTLVRTRDGVARWAGDPIVVTPTDPFSAQAEIANKVVSAIGVAIGSRERASLAAAPTKNPLAYEYYLRARSAFSSKSPRVDLLDSAIALDSSFALAYAEVARELATRDDSVSSRRREAALRTALALDPELPEAHFARGLTLWFVQSRVAEAITELTRASSAKPGDAGMLSMLATSQIVTGQTAEGFANIERTTVLDPRDPMSNKDAAVFSMWFKRFDAAERHARRMIAIDPQDWEPRGILIRITLARGDTAMARREWIDAQRLAKPPAAPPKLVWMLPKSFAMANDSMPVPLIPNVAGRYATLGAWARETGHARLARVYFDSGVANARRPANALTGRSIDRIGEAGLYAISFAGAGQAGDARRAISYADSVARLNALPDEPYTAEAQDYIAYALLLLGDRDAAVARLERLLALPAGRTPASLKLMWPYQSLHEDPRFRRLVETQP